MAALIAVLPPAIVFFILFIKWTDVILFENTGKKPPIKSNNNVVTTECYQLVRCKKCGE
jgi:hypothetical protein